MICLEQVHKFILSNINLTIPQGAFVGVIGASGAGKTTLLKLACGLLQPDKGVAYTLGKNPVRSRKELGTRLGVFLPQHPILQGQETVEENFQNRKLIYGMKEQEFRKEYQELAECLGFQELLQERIKNLSLGQRRRVELAAVLLHRPKLLLLDEPTAGLDQDGKDAFYQLLQERNRQGATIVLTSHNMWEISLLCQRIVLLDCGRLCYYGEKDLLMKKYAPMDRMELTISGELPDMEDLPVHKYRLVQDKLIISYNSNHITAAEILRCLLQQTSIMEVNIRKPDLTDIILQLPNDIPKKEWEENESFY